MRTYELRFLPIILAAVLIMCGCSAADTARNPEFKWLAENGRAAVLINSETLTKAEREIRSLPGRLPVPTMPEIFGIPVDRLDEFFGLGSSGDDHKHEKTDSERKD